MRKYILMILFLLPLTCAFANQPVGNKMKQDPQMQEKGIDVGEDFPYAAGDTIIITADQTHYLTGEKIANWVYNVMHTIKAVGGKRFPNGVLIEGIMSWVEPKDLRLVNPVERTDSAAKAATHEVLKYVVKGPDGLTEAEREHKADSVAAVKAAEKAAEQQKAKEVAEQSAREDSIRQAQEQANFDSDAFERRQRDEEVRRADSLARMRQYKHKQKEHRFSIGVRGGVASLMQNTKDDAGAFRMGNWRAGGDGMLDLQYAYYAGAKDYQKCNLGVITGVSVGYANSPLKCDTVPYAKQTAVTDMEGKQVLYSIEGTNFTESDGQIQVEIPVLFSIRHESGYFFNVGPRFMLPVFSHYKQNIDNGQVVAFYEEEGVRVVDEYVTGKYENREYNTKQWSNAMFNILLTGEMGYEWTLRNGQNLGLGVYGNYSLANLYDKKFNLSAKNFSSTSDNVLINTMGAQKQDDGSVRGEVKVNSAVDTYAKGRGFFDCGLKLVYHFNFPVKK